MTETMTRLLLIKHATSTWNEVGRWQGSRDEPLSATGIREAHASIAALDGRGFGQVASSDLQRAYRTAQVLAEGLRLPPPSVERRLREYDAGEWVGLTRAEIEARWPGALGAWRDGRLSAVPGGEDREVFLARVLEGLCAVAEVSAGPTLVVTHGGVIEAVTTFVGAAHIPMRSMAGRWFDVEDGVVRAGPDEAARS
jgi:broad specificity phosphatase PhoE